LDYYLTVGQLTARIKEIFELDPVLQDVWVLGEVSAVSKPDSGHIYFVLKDDSANLNCVVWKNVAWRLGKLLQTGSAVIAHGRMSVYELRGVYQLYVDDALPVGTGQLYIEFERLKARLQAEGLFAVERKRALPPFPRRIGVVTSASGAAFQDILKVLRRRYPIAEVVLASASVQGAESPAQVVQAIQALNRLPDIDVIIVARGGGSPEELWTFNDEAVAYAIFNSKVPVVSGIGHEIDYTIADFVADVRAPTPSAAAEMSTPDLQELTAAIGAWQRRLRQLMDQRLEGLRQRLSHQQRILKLHSPRSYVDTQKQHVDWLVQRVAMAAAQRIGHERNRVESLLGRLAALSPQATLDRGYAIVMDRESGRVICRVRQVNPDQSLTIRVSDGQFGATVE